VFQTHEHKGDFKEPDSSAGHFWLDLGVHP